MGDRTGIEWTDASWNPVVGCTKVSPGCDHCYAERVTRRFGGDFSRVTLKPGRLDQPLRWRRPRRVFVNSMSDLFHDAIPDEYIAQVFAVMAAAPQHTFQVLTKRHGRMRSLLRSGEFFADVSDHAIEACGLPGIPWPLPNVWLGVSVESQQWADIRIPALLDTPAAVRFLSCEPLLGPVTFRWAKWQPIDQTPGAVNNHLDGLQRLDWVITGGESGPQARPMHPQWVRTIRGECFEAGVAFLHKQNGEWLAREQGGGGSGKAVWLYLDGTTSTGALSDASRDSPVTAAMFRVGKKAAGRELDGRTWDEYPRVVAPC